jgi:predicted DNA binding CopG/RHH family protein
VAKQIENTERISTFITKELLDKLKRKAESKGMSVSGYIRMLIIEATKE